ncbi:MAG: hypothetical protein ABI120_25410, partial [Gemmatimonadaceae bacterium]
MSNSRVLSLVAAAALQFVTMMNGPGVQAQSAVVTAPDPSRMPPPGWKSSPKQFDAIKVATDLMIPTRDGKRMA